MTERSERTYYADLSDDGGASTRRVLVVPAGTEKWQDAEAARLALEEAEDWASDGEWGDEGAVVTVYIELSDNDYENISCDDSVEVEIEPNHDKLIRAAGGDTKCKHRWTSEGEGGCKENPGVWGGSGTSLAIYDHCARCGLRRHSHLTGVQRNPGEHDTVEYSVADNWCKKCQRDDDCACEHEDDTCDHEGDSCRCFVDE